MTAEKLKGLESLNEIEFTEEERALMTADFDFMAEKEEFLQSAAVADAEPMVHVLDLTNVLREDVRHQPFTRESLLEGAPEHTEDSWVVPRLVK